jgi:hypothetical protein
VKKNRSIKYSAFLFFGIVLLALSSCKTTRVATTSDVRPINSNKLIRNIEANAFDYKHLSIKRINCQFDNGKTKTSFRASIQAEKDERITVMLSKLNIPVGRLWLTPDSVKFINYLEKTYFLGDYRFLSSMMDMDIDFETVHAIISNNVFSLRDEKRDKENRDYDTKIVEGKYVLESVAKPKASDGRPAINDRRSGRRPGRIQPEMPVRQTIFVDPETFKLTKINLDDAVNSRKLNIEFSEFTTIGNQLYPGDIFLHFVNPESYVQLKVSLAGFSMDKENEVRFKVPERYTRLNNR